MIDQGQIKKLAVNYQSLELNVRREYYQHLFLSYFYQQNNSDKVYFKGGTALRIVYGSPRFSEDLDFSADLKSKLALEKVILATLEEIQRENIEVDLKEAKETSGGYLAIVIFDKVEIQLQISLRESGKKSEVVTIASDFIPPYTIVALAQEQLVGEKIRALLSRQKPRDFYDLYYILRSGLVSLDQRKLLLKVSDILEKTKIGFESELKLFLPRSHWTVIRDFRKTLEREIGRN